MSKCPRGFSQRILKRKPSDGPQMKRLQVRRLIPNSPINIGAMSSWITKNIVPNIRHIGWEIFIGKPCLGHTVGPYSCRE